MAITSIAQLKSLLEKRIQQALILTQEEIYDTIQKHLERFYDDYDPVYYERTYQFLNSLIKTNIEQKGNSISCSVQLDEDYLKYHYPGNPGWSGNVPADGIDVATWANDPSHVHTHGYTVSGNVAWWSDAMEELGGRDGILNIMKKNLKAAGVPIK